MNSKLVAIIVLTGVLACAGCATKTYGRQGALTDAEKNSLTCREIDQESAKTLDFMNQVNKKAQASGADVVAQLLDYGIGNENEKKAALDSAEQRLVQLRDLRSAKKCGV